MEYRKILFNIIPDNKINFYDIILENTKKRKQILIQILREVGIQFDQEEQKYKLRETMDVCI